MYFVGSIAVLFTAFASGRADVCEVCGNGQVVTKPDEIVTVGTQPPIACSTLQSNGMAGVIDPDFCGLIPALIGPTCGCEDSGPIAPVYPTTMAPATNAPIDLATGSTVAPDIVSSTPNTIAPISGGIIAPISVSPVISNPDTLSPSTLAPVEAPTTPPVVTPLDPSNAPIEAPVPYGGDDDDDAPKMKDDKVMKEKKQGKNAKVDGDKKGGNPTRGKGHNVKGDKDKHVAHETDDAGEPVANGKENTDGLGEADTDAAEGDEVLPAGGGDDDDDDDDDGSSSSGRDKGGKKTRRKVDKVSGGGSSLYILSS
jgi:hypothetical protein